MKKMYLFLLFSCCLLSTARSEMIINNNAVEEELDIKEEFPASKLRSLIKPFQAFITDQVIEMDFNATVGTLNIAIYDEAGSTVYEQSVNAFGGQQLLIDISSLEAGEYTIEFVNAQGVYLFGRFEIE